LSLANQTLTASNLVVQSNLTTSALTTVNVVAISAGTGNFTVGDGVTYLPTVNWTDSQLFLGNNTTNAFGSKSVTVKTGSTLNLSTTTATSNRGIFLNNFNVAAYSIVNQGSLVVGTTNAASPNFLATVGSGTRGALTTNNLTWTSTGNLVLTNLDYQAALLNQTNSAATLYIGDSNVQFVGLTLAGALSMAGFPVGGTSYNLSFLGSLDYSAGTASVVNAGISPFSTFTFNNTVPVNLASGGLSSTTRNLGNLVVNGTGTVTLLQDLGLLGNLTQGVNAGLNLTNRTVLLQGNLSLTPTLATQTTVTSSTLIMVPAAGASVTAAAYTTGVAVPLPLNDFVLAQAQGGAATMTQNSALKVHRLMAFRGTWNPNGNNLTTTEDFVAYGPSYRPYTLGVPTYNPSDDGEIASRGFAYYTDKLGYPYFGNGGPTILTLHTALNSAFGLTLHDGTARTDVPDATTAAATTTLFNNLNGITLTVGRNFYNFGASMMAGTAWTLNSAPKWTVTQLNQAKATDWFGLPFSVAIATTTTPTMTIQLSTASPTVAAAQTSVAGTYSAGPPRLWTSAVNAASSTGWDTTQPDIDSVVHPATRFDNLVEVKFTKTIRNLLGEVAYAVGTVTPADYVRFGVPSAPPKINAVAAKLFDSATAIGTVGEYGVSALPSADIATTSSISFVAATGSSWNTDATGTSAGGANAGAGTAVSTDRSGSHRSLIPDITIEKGRLYDSSGNPIVNHDDTNYNGANSAAVEPRLRDTVDRARPVLISIALGQAAKNFAPTTYEDGHNYWHFIWSEPVILDVTSQLSAPAHAAISTPGSQVGSIPSATGALNQPTAPNTTFGDSYTVSAGTVQLTGLAQYGTAVPGGTASNLYIGSQAQGSGFATTGNQTSVAPTNSLARSAAGNDLYVYLTGYTGAMTGNTTTWNGYWWGDTTSPAGGKYNIPGAPSTYVNQVTDNAATPNAVEDVNVSWLAASGGPDPKTTFTIQNDPLVSAAVNTNAAHASWEVDAPSFAPYTGDNTNSLEVIPYFRSGLYPDEISEIQFHLTNNMVNSGEVAWNSSRNPDTANQNYFGVRDTSLTNFVSGFQLQLVGAGSYTSPSALAPTTSVDNSLFDGAAATPVSVSDDGYFTLPLNQSASAPFSSWKPSSTYLFQYTALAGMATNLAGRLIPDTTGTTINRTPPYITLTLAGNGNRNVYVQFSRSVEALPMGASPTPTNLANVFTVTGLTGGNTLQSVTLLNPSGTTTSKISQTFQEAILVLAQPLSPADLTSARIQVRNYTSASGNPVGNSSISAGQNDMDWTVTYPISFLGIDLVQPVWATDGSGGEANTSGTAHVIHDFAGGDYLTASDITLQAKVFGGAPNTSSSLQLFYDFKVPSNLVTNGIWLPAGFYEPTNLTGLVPLNGNAAARYITPTQSNAAGDLKTFVIPGSDSGMVNGSAMQFLFRLGSMFAVRGTSSSDPRQIAMYQFPLKAIKTQKNGVTILHNVIDPTKGQQTEILYTMKKSGVVTVEVFALDGSAVQVLHRGRQAPGDYSLFWDGKNAGGNIVARGIYFIRVVAPDTDETRNVMVIK